MIWTDEMMDRLTKLWAEGYSASECAIKMGHGLSRNAIIGKVDRMQLPERRTRIARVKAVQWSPERRAANSERMRKFNEERRAKAPQKVKIDLPDETWAPLPGTTPIGMIDLSDATCRWPVSDGAPFLFCGCQTEGSSSYCATHTQVSVRQADKAPKRRPPYSTPRERMTRAWLELA